MRNHKKKYTIIWSSLAVLIAMFVWNSKINADSCFLRYFFRDEPILYISAVEQPILSVVLGGKRKEIKAVERDKCYFFLPQNISLEKINIWDKNNDRLIVRTEDECGKENSDIIFMKSGGQAACFIESKENIEDLTTDKSLKASCKMEIYNKNGDKIFEGKTKFTGHGNGSWENNEKKSWRIKFKEGTSVLGLKRGKEYVLVSNAQDLSYLRNKFTYEFAKQIGCPYVPESDFVNVYLMENIWAFIK